MDGFRSEINAAMSGRAPIQTADTQGTGNGAGVDTPEVPNTGVPLTPTGHPQEPASTPDVLTDINSKLASLISAVATLGQNQQVLQTKQDEFNTYMVQQQ